MPDLMDDYPRGLAGTAENFSRAGGRGLILKVNPILLGSGIPLFAKPIPQTSLELADSKIYSNGFMLLRYAVKPE